jgi:hypothetical protein
MGVAAGGPREYLLCGFYAATVNYGCGPQLTRPNEGRETF